MAKRTERLAERTVAILATDGFEQVELTEPKRALEEAGADVRVVAPEAGEIRGWDRTDWGDSVPVDVALDDADPADFDALVLPGGVMNPDQLRRDERATDFVRAFVERDALVAAICHAPWTLIDAEVVDGRRMTSYHTVQTDLKNAGAQWVDEAVVVDRGILTSRNPDDIPAFNDAVIERIAAGAPEVQLA